MSWPWPVPMEVDIPQLSVRKAQLGHVTMIPYNRNHPEILAILRRGQVASSRYIHSKEDVERILQYAINNQIKPPYTNDVRMFIQELLFLMSEYAINENIKQFIYDKIMKHEKYKAGKLKFHI